jgi:hypothetical protein
MTSYHMTPGFPFFSRPDGFTPTEDYNALWSDYAGNDQPSAVHDPFIPGRSRKRSLFWDINGSSRFPVTRPATLDLFGDPGGGGANFSNIDAADHDASVFTSTPAPKIYMQDLINNLDEVNEVSIYFMVLDRAQ